MAITYPTARQVFHSVWYGARLVFRQAPHLVLIAFSICMLIDLCRLAVGSDDISSKAFRVLLDGISMILLVPFYVGAYRLIILDEQPAHYLAYFCDRFRRYFKWAGVFWVPTLVGEIMPESGLMSILLPIGLAIIVIIVSVRLLLLFPALAAGLVNVTATDAWHDSRGRIWLIVRTMLAIVIPFTAALAVWIACIMMLGLVGSTADLPFWKAMLRAVTDSTIGIIATVVMIANTALLFDVIGDRVKRESPVSPEAMPNA
ncbi:hypothetical protein [Tardiphaga robiniae]|uniref:Glycerophosphoryl diester phosphodiesterase membrane domain-containing protein n=1 Tax=Tardiphaga robiniae TaxID=943830 RepID=A0A163YMY9_9BRAD|nr:hypothetical protein [Tardiphaga robiniae]KZD22333.1 hypothetical protein A4A58_09860 [Tardiphaga robiniae]